MSEDRTLNERVIPRLRASMELDSSLITILPNKVLSGLLDYIEELERMAQAADAAAGVLMLSAPGEATSLRNRITKAITQAQKAAKLYGA